MKLKKQDILLLCTHSLSGLLAALLAGVLLLGAFLMLTRKSGAEVVVKVAGEQVTSISLDKDTKYTIHGVNGGTNQRHEHDQIGQAELHARHGEKRRNHRFLPVRQSVCWAAGCSSACRSCGKIAFLL